MKKWQEILGWIKVKLIKPRMTKKPKTQEDVEFIEQPNNIFS